MAGYWGIGKLCLLAQQRETRSVQVDLLAKSLTPASPEFSKLVSGYFLILQRHLSARRIPENWVTSATIELDFKPESPAGKLISAVTWGSLFRLTVTITDDMKKVYSIYGYSYCGPHNPRKESKSTGAERF